jgi:thiol-disulfide isomerase/thioredoxin
MYTRSFPTALACIVAIAGLSSTFGKQPKLRVGDLPPAKLGWHVKLPDYQGKIVIISFFASWCGPCRKELPVLSGIQKAASRDKVVVFAVNWKEDDQQFRAIERALKSYDLTLISDESGYLGNEYDVDAIPHMIVVGRDGKIASIHVGYGEEQLPELVAEINALWRSAPVAVGVAQQ